MGIVKWMECTYRHRAIRAVGEADEVVNTAEVDEMDRVLRQLKMENSCQPMKILHLIQHPVLLHPTLNPPVIFHHNVLVD